MATSRRTIAVVSDSVLPFNKGGKETRILHLTQELARLGHNVHIYTMQWWDGGSTYRQSGITYHAISKRYPLYAGQRRSIKQGLLFGLATLKLLRYNFDLLEVDHMPYFPLFSAKLVSIVKRRPMYATWHEVWGRAYWSKYLGPAGLIAYLIERASVHLPDAIIAVSPHTQNQLRTVLGYRGPLHLVPNGTDHAAIQTIAPASEKSDIIYAGRLLAHKNVDLLVKAVARLRTVQPDIRCLIVGDGPEYAAIQGLIKAHELQRNVIMKGFVPTSEVVFSLMKSSKVFVLPSVREGFGISVIEAFACGLPVITVEHPDNAARHLIRDGLGIVCDPNVTSLTRALRTVLKESPVTAPVDETFAFAWSDAAGALAEVYAS